MNEDQQSSKYKALCVTTYCGLIICCLFRSIIWRIKKAGTINQIQWDLSTLTAADYCVEMKIDKNNYLNWFQNDYKLHGAPLEIPPTFFLKHHLVKTIEKYLNDDLIEDKKK